jgi:polyhydroxyalkanoate synthesis regulator phasin
MSDQQDELDSKREIAYESLAKDLETRVTRVIQSSIESFAKRIAELEERVATLEQATDTTPRS